MQFQIDSWWGVRFLPQNALQCEYKKTTLYWE